MSNNFLYPGYVFVPVITTGTSISWHYQEPEPIICDKGPTPEDVFRLHALGVRWE